MPLESWAFVKKKEKKDSCIQTVSEGSRFIEPIHSAVIIIMHLDGGLNRELLFVSLLNV